MHSSALGTCVALALGAGSLAACYPKVGAAPSAVAPSALLAAQTRWPDATEASLEEGRRLFVSSCARCHGLPALDSATEADWPGVVKNMGPSAKLDDKQQELVLRFVLASRPR
jgi:mono/diheme cytochrome c family protein